MDRSQLVDLVVKELMRRLGPELSSSGGDVLVAGEVSDLPDCYRRSLSLVPCSDCVSPGGFLAVLVPRLSMGQLVMASLGVPQDPVTSLILDGLVSWVPVMVTREALGWMGGLRPGSPLANHYRACLDRLMSFGVRVVGGPEEVATPGECRVAPAEPMEARSPQGSGDVLDLRGIRVVSERDLKDRLTEGVRCILVDPRAIVTPLCGDLLRTRGVELRRGDGV